MIHLKTGESKTLGNRTVAFSFVFLVPSTEPSNSRHLLKIS